MAVSGQASVEVVADFTRFAASFQRDLDTALRGVHLNMTGISDQISNGVRDGVNAANRELQRLGNQSGQIFNNMGRQSSQAGQTMAASFAAAGRSMSAAGDQMSMALTLPIAAVGAATINASGDFEQAMNKVKAATESSGQAFTDLRNLAIDLGSTTAFSAKEAAFAMNELATAGFDTTEIMGALPGVLDMAAAGSVGLSEAAEIASGILNGFGFAATDLGRVNDILARTFLSTATTLSDLGNSFKYVGPTAKSAGLTFTETAAAIGLMGNAGIKGSMAGTALNASIARLLKPTKEVENTLKDLGITVTNSAGKLIPLVDIVRQLEKSGADTADMMALFGLEAGPDMMALVQQGSKALSDLDVQLQNAGGTAQKVATTQMEGLNGSLDELSSAAEGLMIAIGDAGLLGWMTSLTKKLTELTAAMAELSPNLLRNATIAAIVVAALGPMLAVFGRMVTAIGEGILAFKKFGGWLVRVAPWLSTLAGPIGWAIAALIALGVATVVAYNKSDAFRAVVDRAFRAVATAALWMWQNAIMPAFTWISAKTKELGAALVSFWNQAQPVIIALGAAVLGVWNRAIRPALLAIAVMFVQAGAAIVAFWNGSAKPALSDLMAVFQRLTGAVRSWWVGNGDTVMASAAQVVTWFGGVVTTVWSQIMTILKGFAAVITWVIANVTIPLWKAMIVVVRALIAEMILMKPMWIVLGSIVVAAVTVVVAVVKVLWAAINIAFTAMGAIINWWRTSVVVPVFKAIGTAIQTLGAYISWVWTSVTRPILMFIGTAIGLLGTAIIWLWTSVFQPAFQGIGTVITWLWTSIIQPVFNFISAAIQTVIGVVVWFWTTFGPIWIAVGTLIWTVWSGVFSIVFDLLKLGFYAVMAVLQIFWTVIQVVFAAVAGIVVAVWSTVIQPVLSMIGDMFTWLWGVIQPVVNAVGAAFTWLWTSAISPVVSAVASALSWLWDVIRSVFTSVVSFVRSAINQIVSAAGGVSDFVNSISSHFQAAVNSIRDKLGTAISVVRGLPGQISNAVGNLGSLLYGAGQNVINGLINGISSRIGALRSKIHEAANAIRNALPFSPAKEGPLSGKGDPTIAGGKIVMMVAEGMKSQAPSLRAAAWNVADSAMYAKPGGLAGGLSPIGGVGVGGGGGGTVVFQPGAINVTFSGVVPTAAQAKSAGGAVGQGIVAELARSRTSTLVRSI